jgi:hypothetical protein
MQHQLSGAALLVGLVFGSFLAEPARAQEARSLAADRSPEQVYYERILEKVEPGLVGKPERLPLCIECFVCRFLGLSLFVGQCLLDSGYDQPEIALHLLGVGLLERQLGVLQPAEDLGVFVGIRPFQKGERTFRYGFLR